MLTGNIKALPGSQLFATDNTVAGSIQTDSARNVSIVGGSEGGGIAIVGGPGGDPFGYLVASVDVTGGIYLSKNSGPIEVSANVLPTGNITVSDNIMPGAGQIVIRDNTVAATVHVIKNTGDIFVSDNFFPQDDPLAPTSPGKDSIKIEDNDIPAFLVVQNNSVPQNLQVFKNTGLGVKSVQFNTASESVQCWENTEPFTGFPNTAPKLEGQCGVPPTAF